MLVALLQAYPDIRGVLLEQPQVLPSAAEVIEAAGLTSRLDLVGGDFFAAVPSGNAFVIKSCLHNFADDRVVEVLRVIRRAMPPGAPLLVAETVVPAGNGPHYSKFDDIEMLAIAGGADRSEREWVELLTAAGLRHARMIPCGERFSLLEAYPE